MSIEKDDYQTKPRNGKIFIGVILLGIGMIKLLQSISSYIFPDWLISFPMFVIAFGLYIGAKHAWRKIGWIFIVVIGMLMLSNKIVPGADMDRFLGPVIIISIGLYIIAARNHRLDKDYWVNLKKDQWKPDKWSNWNDPNQPEFGTTKEETHAFKTDSKFQAYSDDYIDTVSVFGGVKKTILSKDFKGGEIVNIFGGAELDFTQADITGRVIVDVTQLFGGIKLVVPPHWQVVTDLAAIFSGNDDKRRPGAIPLSPDKILVLKGVSIFAGIDIRSY